MIISILFLIKNKRGENMFIKPKEKFEAPLDIKISHDAMVILQEYSSYTGFDISDMLVKISEELLNDKAFVEYFKSKRSNKKIMAVYSKNILHKGFVDTDIDDSDVPFKEGD